MSLRSGRAPKSVRGVLEALDQNNAKVALKRSEVALQRHPSNVFCKALCAVALELSDRREEALEFCREVKRTRTADPQILAQLRTVYQRAGLHAEVTSIYEVALEEDKNCEDNGVSLFLALAAEARLVRQQQVALQLYRQFSNIKYLHWAVATILLQVSAVGPHRSLDLAETLLQRTQIPLAQGFDAAQSRDGYFLLLRHLAALRQQRKYEQALKLLADNEERITLAADAARLRLQLLAEAGARAAVVAARVQYLRCLDQWSAAREYIYVAFRAQGFLDVAEAKTTGNEISPFIHTSHASTASIQGSKSPNSTSAVSLHSPNSRTSVDVLEAPSYTAQKPVDAKDIRAEILDFSGRIGGAMIAPESSHPIFSALEEDDGITASHEQISSSGLDVENQEGDDLIGSEVHDAFKLFKQLQTTARDHGSRVPFLAELEMRMLSFACSELEALQRTSSEYIVDHRGWIFLQTKKDLTDFIDAIVNYFERHGHRGGCYADLKTYLCILDDGLVSTLLEKIQQAYNNSQADNGERTWAGCCADAQRHLALARIRRGLRMLEGSTLEQAALEVSTLLRRWDDLRTISVEEDMDMSKSKFHGLREELRPTADVDDLLLLAVAHLLDMDRASCSQQAPFVICGHARIPGLRSRVYMMDALSILELGTKLSPFCQRFHLLLAILYGSLGAGLPLRKHYEMLGLQHVQHEALSHILLDRLLGLGRWDDVREVCQRVLEFHEEFDRQTRSELSGICQEDGARSLHRSREYIHTLDSMARSVMRGRARVEKALAELSKLQSGAAMSSYLSEIVEQLLEIAHRPISSWTASETQDRSIFKDFHSLPRCSPLQALGVGAIGASNVAWPRGVSLPMPSHWVATFRGPQPHIIVSATGAAWPIPSDAENIGVPPMPPPEPSAIEELMAPRREASPGLLKIRALLLLMIHAMLRTTASEDELSELLHEFQAALANEGLAAHCDPGALFESERQNATEAVVEHMMATPPQTARSGNGNIRTGKSGASPHILRTNDQAVDSGSQQSMAPNESRAATLQRSMAVGGRISAGQKLAASGVGYPNEQEDIIGSLTMFQLGVKDKQAGEPPPWRLALISTDDLFWRCSLLACDVVHRTFQAMSAAEIEERGLVTGDGRPHTGKSRRRSGYEDEGDHLLTELMAPPANIAWDALRRGLSVLRIVVRECAKGILQEPSPASTSGDSFERRPVIDPVSDDDAATEAAAIHRGEPFCLGGHGIPMLSSFLLGPVLVLLPVVMVVSSKLAKYYEATRLSSVGRQSHSSGAFIEAFELARVALAEMVDELLAVLKEILQGVLGAQAQAFDHFGSGSVSLPPRVDFCGNAPGGIDLEKMRRIVGNNLVGSHTKQLHGLEEILKDRIHFLRGIHPAAKS